MDDEDYIEIMKNQNHKLESELKIKAEMLNHLIYENDTLLSENQKLLEMNSQEKSTVSQLVGRIKTLTGELEEINYLNNLNKKLEIMNKELKEENEQHICTIKEMKELMNSHVESPTINLHEIEFQYKCQIKDLVNENKSLSSVIESQVNEINKLKNDFIQEVKIFQSKIETYKELIQDEKERKEEIESELQMLKYDIDKPDFNKQGNNMYFEVDDRRILAEKRVLEYQAEFQSLRKSNSELRAYLEQAFDAYSQLKDEELRDFKRVIVEENAALIKENRSLSNYCKEINDYMTAELLKYRDNNGMNESGATAALRIQLNMTKGKIKAMEEEVSRSCQQAEERKNKLFSLYKENDKLTKEIASLKSQIDNYEARLGWFDKIIPLDKLREYEEQQQRLEESLNIRSNQSVVSHSSLPPQVFGQCYELAKYSDKLVFDPFGNPIQNKLTKRILLTAGESESDNVSNGNVLEPSPQSLFKDAKVSSLQWVEKKNDVKPNIVVPVSEDKSDAMSDDELKEEKSEKLDKENYSPINDCPESKKSNIRKLKYIEVPEDVPECVQS